jgi:hypothetical protein
MFVFESFHIPQLKSTHRCPSCMQSRLLTCFAIIICWSLIAISAIDSFLVDTSHKAGFVHCFFYEDSKGIQRNTLIFRDITNLSRHKESPPLHELPKIKTLFNWYDPSREQNFFQVRRLRSYYFFISLYRVWKLGLQELYSSIQIYLSLRSAPKLLQLHFGISLSPKPGHLSE